MEEERLEGARQALREFLRREDVSKFERFLPKLVAEDYDDVDILAAATRVGLAKCGLTQGLIDRIVRSHGNKAKW
eukprot:CAMPEP_0202899310 /NCGR_PEP_ID=MMETSP1392-20130828/7585_1 /ASSEMBLY_ACC=CAM_ASM_000868 /TAXON_ID=225041 /ORGANISM="Chlamydomonas chlamydogama, Strain SAG 11-48b" /LENGTH=74 /DNA_ID=CAMNT_0049585465 /DNA_START=124 /DNA_END=348 /DNA_ORIENTATION=+